MTALPSWVSTSLGIFCILGSILFVVLTVIAMFLLAMLSDIGKQIKVLSSKVEGLTDKVQTIAEKVDSVTTEVGARTTGIVRMVDESASGALRILEMLAPVFMVVGAFWKLKRGIWKR